MPRASAHCAPDRAVIARRPAWKGGKVDVIRLRSHDFIVLLSSVAL